MNDTREMVTVGELAAFLLKLDQKGKIGIRASCCSHIHDVEDIRVPNAKDHEEERSEYAFVISASNDEEILPPSGDGHCFTWLNNADGKPVLLESKDGGGTWARVSKIPDDIRIQEEERGRRLAEVRSMIVTRKPPESP